MIAYGERMIRLAWSSLTATALTLLLGCSTNVISGGGTGGSTTTTSAGGADTGGAPAVKTCGGKQGLQCAPDEWCQWDPPGTCGNADGAGTCQPKPSGACPPDCPGVCGCNGGFYCNVCEAHDAGMDVDPNGTCNVLVDAGGPDPEYRAYVLPTVDSRYVVTKAEHAADRCVVLYVTGGQLGTFDVQAPQGWSVERLFVSPRANDCAMNPGALWEPPDLVLADVAEGTITQDKGGWPCAVNLDVTVAWPSGSPAWVPAETTLQTSSLVVMGGVCGG
jgi:hypothetical protein